MLIVRKRSKKEVSEENRGKARRRAVLLRRVFFFTLIAGLLVFFVYNNVDYFSLAGERAKTASEAKKSERQKPPGERRSVAELLGAPEFSDGSAAMPLNSFIEERVPEPDTVSHIVQALLSHPAVAPEIEEPDTVSVRQISVSPEPVPARDAPAAQRPEESEKPKREPAKPDTPSIRQVSLAAAPKQGAPARVMPGESGSMMISNIRCRLADRDDISINVSVELFYDSRALHEELHFKRGTLAAVLGSVVRRQEYGNVASSSLRGELLDAFNDVLASGRLSGVDIKDFRVVQ